MRFHENILSCTVNYKVFCCFAPRNKFIILKSLLESCGCSCNSSVYKFVTSLQLFLFFPPKTLIPVSWEITILFYASKSFSNLRMWIFILLRFTQISERPLSRFINLLSISLLTQSFLFFSLDSDTSGGSVKLLSYSAETGETVISPSSLSRISLVCIRFSSSFSPSLSSEILGSKWESCLSHFKGLLLE